MKANFDSLGDFRPTVAQLEEAEEQGCGFCSSCHEEACGIEPGAENYQCGECGRATVHGPSVYILLGQYK